MRGSRPRAVGTAVAVALTGTMAACGQAGGAGGGGGGSALPLTTPGLPSTPSLPLPRARRESVAGELVGRLNPFRATKAKRAKAARR